MLGWTRLFKIPGGRGASVYDIGNIIIANISDLRLSERAASISFNFLMAIPALLIFLFSLIPYLPLENVQKTIFESLKLLSLNEKLYEVIAATITDLMETKRKELISFSILTIIYVSSNGLMGLIRGFDRKSNVLKNQNSFAKRGRAIVLTVVIIILTIVALALLIIQSNFISVYILEYFNYPAIIQIVSWFLLVLTIYFIFALIYRYGPSLENKLHFFSPGAAIATIAFFAVTYGFFFAVNHFIHYNQVYGSFGTLLMLMVWIFISGWVIIVGYEINLSILSLNKERKAKKKFEILETK